jgi:hypothetical protein
VVDAATRIGTIVFMPYEDAVRFEGAASCIVPLIPPEKAQSIDLSGYQMVELPHGAETSALLKFLKIKFPNLLVSIRMIAKSSPENIRSIIEYHRLESDLIHYVAGEDGHEMDVENGLHLKDLIKEVNFALLKEGIRDEVTFLVSGGIAMAEHVIKAMLCGANLVGVDTPLLIALECRVCGNCREGIPCPVSISKIQPKWGAQRIVNLLGAWHNQLLEMMGAMGIREARRLRGERGRVMFREDLENDTFAQLFTVGN